MGKLFDTVRNIDGTIQRKNLPFFRTKGLIALRAGFSLSLIEESTPDDAQKLAALRAAAREVLGEPVP